VQPAGDALQCVLSSRDLGGRTMATAKRNVNVADLMTDRVVAVAPDTPVRKAANLMRGRWIGCLVVTKADRVVGIVTAADLLELLGRGADRPSPLRKRADLHYRVPHRGKKKPGGSW
jgi:predicted transcriptional regulator